MSVFLKNVGLHQYKSTDKLLSLTIQLVLYDLYEIFYTKHKSVSVGANGQIHSFVSTLPRGDPGGGFFLGSLFPKDIFASWFLPRLADDSKNCLNVRTLSVSQY